MGGGGKKSTPSGVSDAMSGFGDIGEMSKEQIEKMWGSANERQDWSQEQWDKNKERLAGIDEQLLGYGEDALRRSSEDRARYEELYQPIEEQYLDKVKNFDTEERRASEAASAQTEVASQADAARQNALRRLESYGVDPSQTRNSALDAGVRMEEAKAKAGAASTARRDIEKTGMALEEGTIGAGRGLDTQSKRGAASGASGIPQFGMDQKQMFQQGDQAMGSWGDALSAAGGMAAQDQGNKNSAFGSMLGAGATLGAAMLMAEGGEVAGAGGPTDDAIPAALSDGEFIIPADVVKRKGTEFFDKLIEKVKTENAEREENAQVTQEAMAIPPPEAIPPEMGMYKGGEVLAYAEGGEAVKAQLMPKNPDIRKGYASTRPTGVHNYMGPETKWPSGDYPPPPGSAQAGRN